MPRRPAETRPAVQEGSRRSVTQRLTAAAAAAALLAGGTAAAAQHALPGDHLYPVKRLGEALRTGGWRGSPDADLRSSEYRLQEAERLAARTDESKRFPLEAFHSALTQLSSEWTDAAGRSTAPAQVADRLRTQRPRLVRLEAEVPVEAKAWVRDTLNVLDGITDPVPPTDRTTSFLPLPTIAGLDATVPAPTAVGATDSDGTASSTGGASRTGSTRAAGGSTKATTSDPANGSSGRSGSAGSSSSLGGTSIPLPGLPSITQHSSSGSTNGSGSGSAHGSLGEIGGVGKATTDSVRRLTPKNLRLPATPSTTTPGS